MPTLAIVPPVVLVINDTTNKIHAAAIDAQTSTLCGQPLDDLDWFGETLANRIEIIAESGRSCCRCVRAGRKLSTGGA